ncbi:M48 family metallopeptidase [Pararhizobium sp. O133]|uniref:M48 family metallopeptidase n=1 Tax=Pararhizobium sp. O133 TaxID=3449278 RepID=UPI003F683AC0
MKLARGYINVASVRPNNAEATRELVERWFLDCARQKLRERLEESMMRFPEPEAFRPTGLTIRQLEMRWGSMSPAGRLLLNRRLIHAPIDAIDYVITHELCHIEVPNHGNAFFSLLGRVMPDWEKRKRRLETMMV